MPPPGRQRSRRRRHRTRSRPDYAAQLSAAPDYLEFVRSLFGAARAGDHAAQFYIFRAIETCREEYRLYFNQRGGRRTLDQALISAAGTGWPFDPEEVRRVHARCNRLVEAGTKDFGEHAEWLRLASEGGYPLAQVAYAQYQAHDVRRTKSDDGAKREERRLLVAKAIRSRDPAVIWEIGSLSLGAVRSEYEDDPNLVGLSWFLAACQRGFECSSQSDAVRMMCIYDRACQPYESVADLFRRTTGEEFPALEDGARWINEKIDAGDWEALGF